MNRICNTCNIEIVDDNYLKDRTVCRSCYKKSRRKINNNTIIQNQQPKNDDKKKRKVVNSVNKTNINEKKTKICYYQNRKLI